MSDTEFKPASISVISKGKTVSTFVCEYRSFQQRPAMLIPERGPAPRRTFFQKLFGIHPPAPVEPRLFRFSGRVIDVAEIRAADLSPADLYFREVMERWYEANTTSVFVSKQDMFDDLVVKTDDGVETVIKCYPMDIEPNDLGTVNIVLGFDWIERS